MKKFIIFLVALMLCLIAGFANAWILVWDQYNDPVAVGLRVYESDDQNFSSGVTTTDIAADSQSYLLSQPAVLPKRMYYRMTAFSAEEESVPTNAVSLFWAVDGSGSVGVSGVGGISLINCKDPDVYLTNQGVCDAAGEGP